jgi:hypothetical protein
LYRLHADGDVKVAAGCGRTERYAPARWEQAVRIVFWCWLADSGVPFRRLNDSRAVCERPAVLHFGARLALNASSIWVPIPTSTPGEAQPPRGLMNRISDRPRTTTLLQERL